ncbi:hypothetical protein RJ639_043831 [Escallonia herrerae]|uniref:SBP-type domain-containing protein n=1 Tax=Escallonia herrerae TaxID=1293975 RepID=A0AA89B556_9ASTE|nr:hypothetical protein RJ639_043831 [Escallonia herrerae]
MEAKFGGKAHHFCGPVVSDLKAIGKKSMEWDLNNWSWDGDLFRATQLNSMPSDCRSRQFFPICSEIPVYRGLSNSSSSGSENVVMVNEQRKRELEKRRRVVVIDDEEVNDEAGSLNLKLGGQVYPITEEETERWEGKTGKKSKVVGAPSNRAVCQVDDCRADLSSAKDYHRRHKVCDLHSKATRALVGSVMQRFCQQCSRFHALQEFDEGKRSCRRRLAGHNRRRRKTHPENAVNGASVNDERGSSYLLISLLRILSNVHSNSSDHTKDQDLLSHLLRNLSSLAGISDRNLSGLLSGPQELQNGGTSTGSQEKDPPKLTGQCAPVPGSEMTHKRISPDDAQGGSLLTPPASQSTIMFPGKDSIPDQTADMQTTTGKMKLNNIDLNNAYDDSQDCAEKLENSDAPVNLGTGSLGCPLWLQQYPQKSSPPQTSGNSGSTSSLSPSSSSGETQSRTDRIVFKLFGKDPSEIPLVLRKKILDWLSHSPTDIESYIRPGCVLLTIYLRMEKSTWEELFCDLNCSLRRLLDASNDSFWSTGWIYARVPHRVAFVYNGQIVLDTPLPRKNQTKCRILSIKPIAVAVSERAKFLVKGYNLSQSTTRLLCALEGKYLLQQSCADMMVGTDSLVKHEEVQSLNFTCSIPDITGRGFIEVEDDGLSSSFLPFIVAEQDVCSEICTLESAIEATETADNILGQDEKTEASNQELDFIHEMGWLLHRSHLKLRLDHMDPNLDLFTFKRFRWLLEFSVDHDWCAVVGKLLSILFSGTVDAGEHPSVEAALLEIGLLHRAVRRNCRPMVEVLLNYCPDTVLDKSGTQQKQQSKSGYSFFRPDATGPGGLTPLHIAASRDGSENVLDALTDDPQSVGIEAWRSARDSTGLTPNDYARMRSHYSYIHLVQKKINMKSGSGHVVLDIPGSLLDYNIKQKLADLHKSAKVASFETEKRRLPKHCKLCEHKLAYGGARTSLAIYRPAMLSMVAIAAVCVCVALLFKSSPEVLYVFQPFRWELLKYGSS